MKRVLFIAVFGLLPIWAAIALVIFAFTTMSSQQAGMTLWAFAVAIPACIVTLAISGATLAVHEKTSGQTTRKRKFAFGFFLVAILSLAIFAQYLSLKRQDTELRLLHEKGLVEQFVSKNSVVQGAAGESVKASVASYSRESGELPIEYDVSAAGNAVTVYAIVRPDRTSVPPNFVLLCITRLSMGQRESLRGPCNQ